MNAQTAVLNGSYLVSVTGLSSLADGVIKVVLPIYATQLTSSPALISGVVVCLSLPWLVASLPVGVMADRLDRKQIIFWANAFRCFSLLAIVLSIVFGFITLPLIYVLSFAIGLGEVIAMTLMSAIVPSAVPADKVQRANAQITGSETVSSEFLGPLVGGLLAGIGMAYALGSALSLYFLSALVILFLTGTFTPARATQKSSVLRDLGTGLRYMKSNRMLRSMTLILAGLGACWSAWLALLPSYALGESNLALSPEQYGFLFSLLGVGGVSGAFLASLINRVLGRQWGLFANLFGVFSMMATAAFSEHVIVIGIGAFLGGFGGTSWAINSRTICQHLIPSKMLGRFFSAYRMIGWGFMPVGAFGAGVIADLFGYRPAFLCGISIVVIMAIIFFRNITKEEISRAFQNSHIVSGKS